MNWAVQFIQKKKSYFQNINSPLNRLNANKENPQKIDHRKWEINQI